jgi:hypothetical protein
MSAWEDSRCAVTRIQVFAVVIVSAVDAGKATESNDFMHL